MELIHWASRSDGNATCVSWTCHWSSQPRSLGSFGSLKLDLTPHLRKLADRQTSMLAQVLNSRLVVTPAHTLALGNLCGSDTSKTIADWIGEEEEEKECRTLPVTFHQPSACFFETILADLATFCVFVKHLLKGKYFSPVISTRVLNCLLREWALFWSRGSLCCILISGELELVTAVLCRVTIADWAVFLF